jgi:hypothetical protein
MTERPERRASGVTDRRKLTRGGRRSYDPQIAPLRAIVFCPACHIGTATIHAVTMQVNMATLTYRCSQCAHQVELNV